MPEVNHSLGTPRFELPLTILPVSRPRPRPWGPIMTLLLTFLIVVLTFLAQILFIGVLTLGYAVANPDLALKSQALLDEVGPWLLVIPTILAAPVAVVLTLVCITNRKGISIREYLGLYWPSVSTAVSWLVLFFFTLTLYNVVASLFITSNVEDFKAELAATGASIPLLLFTLVIVAPVYEEIVFRGFMLPGLAATRLGGAFAVLLTSAAWAVLHFQYDLGGMLQILVIGFILGAARLKTNSLFLCIGLHMAMNALASMSLVLSGTGEHFA